MHILLKRKILRQPSNQKTLSLAFTSVRYVNSWLSEVSRFKAGTTKAFFFADKFTNSGIVRYRDKMFRAYRFNVPQTLLTRPSKFDSSFCLERAAPRNLLLLDTAL